jgi:ribosomal protein S6--L-glutamate ligase
VISAYPDEDWHAQQIVAAAARRGEVTSLLPTDFGAVVDGAETRITAGGRDARDFDLFLTPRALGDDGDAEVQLELYRTLSESGARVVNEVAALTTAIDKLKSSWLFARAGLPTPEVVLAQTLDDARAALRRLGRAVCKPVFGSLGIGVELVEDEAQLAPLLARHGALYLQRLVDGERLDVRAFVVGDRVEAAIARRPREGELCANLSRGAVAESIALDARAAETAVRASRVVGLDYAGVDLLVTPDGIELLEVNGTPSFRGLNEATGRDMAAAVVDHAIQKEPTDVVRAEAGDDGRGGRADGRRARGAAWWRDHARSLRAEVLRADRTQGGKQGSRPHRGGQEGGPLTSATEKTRR